MLERALDSLVEVELRDGRLCRVWNSNWRYDEGESWALVMTNMGPFVAGEQIDVFSTEDVAVIRAPDGGGVLLGPGSTSS